MLKSVVNGGTGSTIRSVWGIDSEFAGKTGTTQDQADGWFIGMTPTLVAGAWVGGEDPSVHFKTLGAGAGGHTALPIVGHFYSQILHKNKFQNMRYATFALPSDESLAMMDIPPYREIMEAQRRNFIHDFFGKKDDASDREIEINKKANPEQTQKEEVKPSDEAEKKPFWQSMKEIFKKKSK